MYHVSAQGVDERMINVHYYYDYHYHSVFPCNTLCNCFGRTVLYVCIECYI